MAALDNQVSGNHYKDLAIQPVQYIHSNNIPFCEGNVIKYVTRWKSKGGIKDLEKAKHFIELLIELESKVNNNKVTDNEVTKKESNSKDNEWIEWTGGKCPVPYDSIVDVSYVGYGSEVTTIKGERADAVSWHYGDFEPNNIRSYRIVKMGDESEIWFSHTPGNLMPSRVNPYDGVQVLYDSGRLGVGVANTFAWTEENELNRIENYKIIRRAT